VPVPFSNVTNEANVDENAIIRQNQEPLRVAANSGVDSGLDKRPKQPVRAERKEEDLNEESQTSHELFQPLPLLRGEVSIRAQAAHDDERVCFLIGALLGRGDHGCFRAFFATARLPADFPRVIPNRSSTSASENDVPLARRCRIMRQKSTELASRKSSGS